MSARVFADAADPVRIVLAACWVTLMLIYLQGDVLRVYAGHYTPGRIEGQSGEWMWVVAALLMLVPISMILVSLLVPSEPLVWITVAATALMVVVNLAGMPYEGAFDNLLLILSFPLNGFVVWAAFAGLRASG